MVLEAWRHWGPAALDRFRGMFAFALADTATGELVLARDPLGIKPLFYTERGDGIVFASELKAIVAALGSELRIEPGALVASMLYYWVPEQRCAIQGVHKLPAGSWARIRPGAKPEIRHYWRVQDVAAEAAGRPAADLKSVIEESVRAHLVADVPVSSFLSGGLDSSIITVLAHQDSSAVDAYTITFRPEDQKLEAMPDDAVYARKVARQFGIDLHEIEISPDIVDLLPRMVDILDEPIGDPAAINTVLMCEAARERGVKVHPVGDGRRRAVRRLPQAPGLPDGQPLPPAARRASAALPGSPSNSLPVSIGDRGLRYPRWAKRFMTFAELPEEARFRRSYTLYDPEALTALVGPELGRYVDRRHRRARRDLQRQRPGRRGQPDVPRRCPAVHGGAQPHLHRPGEHGRLGRGAGAVRGQGRRRGRVHDRRPGQDPRARSRRPRSRTPPRTGCRARSCTGRRRPSARRCAPGSATTSRS